MMLQCSSSILRATALLALLTLLGLGCQSDKDAPPARPERRPLTAAPLAIRMESGARQKNRHHYEVTVQPWGTPNVKVGDEVWRAELPAGAYIHDAAASEPYTLGLRTGEISAAFNEPAPYTQGKPAYISADIGWFGPLDNLPAKLSVGVKGELVSMTDPSLKPIVILDEQVVLDRFTSGDPTIYEGFGVHTKALPERVDLYELRLVWTFSPQECATTACPAVVQGSTHLRVPLTWRDPRRELPRFREPFIWAAAWAAGVWPDGPRSAQQTIDSEIAISRKLLAGFATLDQLGYSYGSFARPKYDGKTCGLEVFLDFPRTACGEFKYALQGIIETHGIDAQWGALHFDARQLGPLSRERVSFYKTRPLAALGRESQHWYYANHAFTMVRGHVFDPTYNVYKPSLAEYDDYMFEKYCYGEDTPCRVNSWCDTPPKDEATRCIPNPPGFEDGKELKFFTGDSYY